MNAVKEMRTSGMMFNITDENGNIAPLIEIKIAYSETLSDDKQEMLESKAEDLMEWVRSTL